MAMTTAMKAFRGCWSVLAAGAAVAAATITVGCSSGSITGTSVPDPVPEKTGTARQALSSSSGVANGVVENGLTTNGLVSNGSWFNGSWFNGSWFNGSWFNGSWFNGSWFNGSWFNGSWFNGSWFNGTQAPNGSWFNGSWFNGLFSNALWASGSNPDGGPPVPGSPAEALQSSAYLRQLLPYIYGCAMPGALDPITNTPIDPRTYDTSLDPNGGALKCSPPEAGAGDNAGDGGAPTCPEGYSCDLNTNTCVIPLRGAVGLAINASGSSWWGEDSNGTYLDGGAGDGGFGAGVGVGGGPGTCDETCQRWVSACLLARTNAYGAHVQISMRAPADAPQAVKNALALGPTESADFPLREGAYYGNIFETAPVPPTPPDAGYTGPATGPVTQVPAFYACAGPESNVPEITKRFCSSQGDQVVINVPGPCLTGTTTTGSTEPGTCAAQDTDSGSSTFGAIQDCYTNTKQTGAPYAQVITVYLRQPSVVCGNLVCETGEDVPTDPLCGPSVPAPCYCPSDCHPGAWSKNFTPTLQNYYPGVKETSNSFVQSGISAMAPDGVVVAGSVPFDVVLGGVTFPANQGQVGLLVKYNPDGSYAWSLPGGPGVRFGNTISTASGGLLQQVNGVAVASEGSSAGNIIVVGTGVQNNGLMDEQGIWFGTFDSNGNPLGNWFLPSTSGTTDVGPLTLTRELAVDHDGNVLLAGEYSTGAYGTESANLGSWTLPAPCNCTGFDCMYSCDISAANVFLAKVSLQGPSGGSPVLMWAKPLGALGQTFFPLSLALDSRDDIVLLTQSASQGGEGTFLERLCSDGSSGTCSDGTALDCTNPSGGSGGWCPSTFPCQNGAVDICDAYGGSCANGSTPSCPDGTKPWTLGVPDPGYTTFSVAAVDPNDDVYASGYMINPNANLGGSVGTVPPTARRAPFLLKYGADGSLQWANYAEIVPPRQPGWPSTGCSASQVEGVGIGFDRNSKDVILASFGNASVGGGIDFGVGGFGVSSFDTYCNPNIFLSAYSIAEGTTVWAKQIPTILGSQVFGLGVDSQNHIVLSGDYGGSMLADGHLLVTPRPELRDIASFLSSVTEPSPLDTTSPAIGAGSDQSGGQLFTVPKNIFTEATSQCGANVFFMPPTALDTGNPSAGAPAAGVNVACSPGPNTTFPIGTPAQASTPVTCTATDPVGNHSSATFTVTVVDTVPPVFTQLPAPAPTEATGPGGALVTYTAPSATDSVDCSSSASSRPPCTPTTNACINAVCTPASGTTLPLGTSTVSCTATDAHGNTSTASFDVAVVDTTPPKLQLPGTITATATSANGAMVAYTATATDVVDGAVTPVCTPTSGSTFAPGSNIVSCTATDAHGNASPQGPQSQFQVQVQYAWSGIQQPVNADGSSIFQLGRTVPVKFQLAGASANITNAVAKLTVAKVSSAIDGTYMEAVSTSAADTGNQFRYDASSGQYVFNLATKGLSTGTWSLSINLGDGVSRTVQISLR
jgi:hypothetical protein